MLIGLHGHAGAGKDTIARMLEPHGYQRKAFADKVREAAIKLDPVVTILDGRGMRLSTLVRFYGWDKAKRLVPEVRNLLDRMGSDVGREMFGARTWIDLLFREIEPTADVVITDVRAENEAQEIHARRGCVVWVLREGVEAPNDHPIHRVLPAHHIDYVLRHDGKHLEPLQAHVDHLAWWVRERTCG